MTGLEILDHLLLGQTVFHRSDDAWDLLDSAGLVTAVLCPRQHHVSIAPVASRVPPAPAGRLIPYAERVELKIGADEISQGLARIQELVATSPTD